MAELPSNLVSPMLCMFYAFSLVLQLENRLLDGTVFYEHGFQEALVKAQQNYRASRLEGKLSRKKCAKDKRRRQEALATSHSVEKLVCLSKREDQRLNIFIMSQRSLKKVTNSLLMREGGGFVIRRAFCDFDYSELDPIVGMGHMVPKNYGPGEAVGAPDHPHRGFEAVTYNVSGSTQHLDSNGSKGVVDAGGVQWMTAGKGVVHAEMPSDEIMKNGGLLEGFQIWVNLPKKLKMTEPRYQDIRPEDVKSVVLNDGQSFVRVIAGKYKDAGSLVSTHTPVTVLDVRLVQNGLITLPIPKGINAMVYCWRGSGHCNSTLVDFGQSAVFDFNGNEDGSATFSADRNDVMHLLFLAGTPIREPIAQGGPFVMNTQEEIIQAQEDYRAGRLGGKIAGADERFRQTKAALATQQKNNRSQ